MSPLIVTLSPLLFLFLTFLEHFVYLRDIQGALLLVSLLGTAYLQFSFWGRLNETLRPLSVPIKEWKIIRHHLLHPNNISRTVLILSICIYTLYASGVIFPVHPITGDEPHYLLITRSLLSDGDINLFNNYRDKDYLQFYPGELDSHARPGKMGHGYEYSKHTPGLSLMLVLPYFIGENLGLAVAQIVHDSSLQRKFLIFSLRISMSLLASLLCWAFFLFAHDLTKNQNVALLSWFTLTVTSPLLFYSHLIYPEIPASLLMLMILSRVFSSKPPNSLSFLCIGLGIAILPWLGAKYTILSAGLFGIVIARYWTHGRMKGKNIFLFIAPLFITLGLFLFYLWSLYGNIWPSSLYKGYISSGSSPSLAIFHFKLSEFFRCGLSYLFDQRIGIFPYSPIYLIFLPGIIIWVRRKKWGGLPLLGILFVYWGFCSLAYYWGGYCPPGRTLLPVLWIIALFLAGALAWGKNKHSVPAQRILLFLSLVIAFISAKDPRILYHEESTSFLYPSGTYGNLWTSLSNSIVDLRLLTPSLIDRDHIVWTPLISWVIALVLLCYLFLKKEKSCASADGSLNKPVISVFLLSALFIAYTFLDIHLERALTFRDQPYTLYFQDSNNFGQELQGFWTRGRQASEVLVKTDTPASEIRVTLLSPAPGKATLRVGRVKRSVPRGRLEGQDKTLHFPSPEGFPWKGGHLYSIWVKEDRGFSPYELDPEVQDNRSLGVFVKIAVETDKK
jgi:hypothetical protein